MKVLVIGKSGQVARALVRVLPAHGMTVHAVGRPQVDLRHPDTVRAAIVGFGPDIVINAAAYTAVDRAEDEPDEAFAINAEGARAVAEATARLGCPCIFFSTDYVFDGQKTEPYTEEDEPNPLNVYGITKLQGERFVASENSLSLILRVSWVFSADGKNFVKAILANAKKSNLLRVVDDQVGGPTFANEIAVSLVRVIPHLIERRGDCFGTFHFCGTPETSWFNFAVEILARAADVGFEFQNPMIVAIKSNDLNLKARRPQNSRLCCKKFESSFMVKRPDWRVNLDECLREIFASRDTL